MEFIQTKPLYNQGYNEYYDHGFYNSPGHVERRGFYVSNNTYKDTEEDVTSMKNNMKKSCSNYVTKQPPPSLDLDDLLDEETSSDEKLDFDLEEHILPPCFDTLINADNQMLAPPDLNILKLASSDLDSTISSQETNSDRLNNNDASLKRCKERNEEQINQFPQRTESNSPEEISRPNVTENVKNENSRAMCEKEIHQNRVAMPEKDIQHVTPPMSEKEIQLIKEVNKTLDCILPVKQEENEDENLLENELDFDNDIFEPLQQVPCLENININSRPNKDYQEPHSSEYDRNINNEYQDDISNNYNNNLCNNYDNNICSGYNNNFCTGGYSTDICTSHGREICNEYSRDLCTDYNRDLCSEYAKELYIKNEPGSLQNGYFVKTEEGASPSFYDLIEEQVRNQKQKRENEARISRKILDRYLPAEQDLIKRYIEGDKAHLPIPPVNMEIQEIIKRERKKHKNRVAASKCRKKKLEREAQLEVRVNYLKERSIELNTVVRDLRNQATTLKQRIMDHINAGCTLNPNVLPNGINPYYG